MDAIAPTVFVVDDDINVRCALARLIRSLGMQVETFASAREIPHYYLQTCMDMSRALRWLEAENQRRPIKEQLLPAVLLLKAVAQALGDVPELNGYRLDDCHQPQEAIHIGFAIALRQGGLIAPAIHHVDPKSLGRPDGGAARSRSRACAEVVCAVRR